MELMQVGRIFAARDVRVVEEPKPVPGEGESLVRVTAVGLCGSDLHWFTEGGIGDATIANPLVLGHEFAGVVEGGPLDGRIVAVDPARPCHHCADCLEGNHNLCVNVQFAGHGSNDGGLREYVAWPTELLFPVPEGMTAIEAALLEPLGVALHAWDLGRAKVGSNIAIVGAGPIGVCLVKLARAAGMGTVVVVEPLEHRRAAALAAGADAVFAPDEDGLESTINAALRHGRVDYVFEITDHHTGAPLAIELAKPGGTVVLAGIPDNDETTFQASVARRKGLTIKVSRRMGDVYPRAVELVSRGIVEVRSLATHVFPMHDVSDAFKQAESRVGLKVVVQPSSD